MPLLPSVFKRYASYVFLGLTDVDETGVVLPVDMLSVRMVPYMPEGSTMIELVDGTKVYSRPTWGYRAELEWRNLGKWNNNLVDFVNYLDEYPEELNLYVDCLDTGDPADGIDRNFVFHSDRYVPNVVPELTDEVAQAVFDMRFRRARPGRIVLHSHLNSYAGTAPTWLAA